MDANVGDYRVAGWTRLAEAVPPAVVMAVSAELDAAQRAGGCAHGMRDVLVRCPTARALAQCLGVEAATVSGAPVRLIRGLLLAKTAAANWQVPWHQDLVIAVSGRRDVTGFRNWSIKQGITHVEPPEPWASGRIALRIHLDPCPAVAGPLRVLAGSHRHGVLDPTAIARMVEASPALTLLAAHGEVLALHPLLLHASAPAQVPGRRVLHLEYVVAALALPDGLDWSG